MARPFLGILHGARHLVLKWQLLGIASVLAILAFGFLAFAVYLRLLDWVGPPTAAAATAGLLILAALAVVGVAAIVTASAPKAAPLGQDIDAATVADMVTTLIDLRQKLDVELRSSAKPLTIAALVVGCVVGYSPALQRKLKDLIG